MSPGNVRCTACNSPGPDPQPLRTDQQTDTGAGGRSFNISGRGRPWCL